ncbi:MAG: phosphotransferase [Gaiellaceae bacterium]
MDDVGREIISFLPGAPIPGTEILSDSEIQSAATLLRRYHDAAAAIPDAVLDGHETVIHGDAGPWNILWVDGRARTSIDFDEARPGERLEDVGYFAWKGLRLVADGLSVADQRRRLSILAETYGVHVDADLLDAIENAVARLAAKGRAERWSNEVLTQLDEERRWHQEIRGRLR